MRSVLSLAQTSDATLYRAPLLHLTGIVHLTGIEGQFDPLA